MEHRMKNADRIRLMTVAEMAEWIDKSFDCSPHCPAHSECQGVCVEALAKWLSKEATKF